MAEIFGVSEDQLEPRFSRFTITSRTATVPDVGLPEPWPVHFFAHCEQLSLTYYSADRRLFLPLEPQAKRNILDALSSAIADVPKGVRSIGIDTAISRPITDLELSVVRYDVFKNEKKAASAIYSINHHDSEGDGARSWRLALRAFIAVLEPNLSEKDREHLDFLCSRFAP